MDIPSVKTGQQLYTQLPNPPDPTLAHLQVTKSTYSHLHPRKQMGNLQGAIMTSPITPVACL